MQLAEFKDVISRATVRCRDLAENEKALGYEESWRMYTDLAQELAYLYPWYSEVLP